jgi:hypothetical protein
MGFGHAASVWNVPGDWQTTLGALAT